MKPWAADFPRRNFLIRSCQGVSAVLLRGFGFPVHSLAAQVQFHPHYRAVTPLDAVLPKVQAGFDEFVAEKEHDKIAAILAQWSAGLRESVISVAAIGRSLAADFRGVSPRPLASRVVRPDRALEVRRVTFAQEASLGPAAFLQALREEFGTYSTILTAEFQVTRIDVRSGGVRTRLRYELVGTGAVSFREQRTGFWDLEWAGDRVRRWQTTEETRSR